jgi:Eco57I restriction endonuclease.
MDAQQVLEKLKSLKSKKDIQELFIDLNFDSYKDDDFDWLDNLITANIKDKGKIDFINIINEYKSFNIFYCKLKIENLYRNRALQREIAKKIARESDCLIIFTNQEEDVFRIVYANVLGAPSSTTPRQQNQQNQPKTALKLSGYTISKDEKLRTASEQLLKIEIKDDISILDLITNIKKAFEIEPVTDEFFNAIKSYIEKLTEDYRSHFSDKQKAKAFALQFFNRLLFLKYIEKKKWLNKNINFLSELIEKFKASPQYHNKNNSSIYEDLLKPLFFFAFSKNKKYYPDQLPGTLIEEIKNLPYLNGGLFEENELDIESIKIPNSVISGIFKDILDKFNFTVTEDTPFDREIAIDPEMLGLIYESIVNAEERSGSGIFYTPRIEVDFMCRKSLLHYFCSNTEILQNKLIDLIFSDSREIANTNSKNTLSIREKETILSQLNDLNVLDPACGSGAFLIGMLQNILEIIIKLDELDVEELYNTEPDYLYKRKKELIEKIIHGVDIKPWAAQLAELRLWLYLIWDFETDIENLTKNPLLPSLDFKIRQGDSLLSEIEGNPIILRTIGGVNYLVPDIHSKVDQIIDLKKKYYQHVDDSITKAQIEYAEKELIVHILNRKRMTLSKKLEGMYGEGKVAEPQHLFEVTEQQKLNFMQAAEKIKEEQDEIEAEIDRINSLIKNLSNIKEKDYFIWEIDFAEIFFAKGGFDIIIGNPPYVRQEEIAPPLIEKEKVNADIKREYKERLISNIISINGKDKISKFNRKADYYVYFYFVCLSLLKNNGIFTFINSNSWLDVGYGTFLQEFLLKNFNIIDIHDNQIKRSFKSASINTIIISIQKPDTSVNLQDSLVKFIMHKVSFEESLNNENIKLIYNSGTVINTNGLRIFPMAQSSLLNEGLEKEEDSLLEGKYIGSKWGGKYLRAPDIYFTILEKGKGKFIELGNFTVVRRGYIPYPYDLYLYTREEIIQNEITSNNLFPCFTNTNYFKKICIKESKDYLLVFDKIDEISPILKSYFFKKVDKLNIVRKNLGLKYRSESQIVMLRTPSDRHIVYLNEGLKIVDHIEIITDKDKEIICGILNSTLYILFREIFGRNNLGLGTLKLEVMDAKKIPFLFIQNVNIKIALNKIKNREIYSVFKEIGIDPGVSIRTQNPKPLSDRFELDEIIFNALNLSEDERKEVYWAVCELVQNRLQKARSV